MNLLDQLLTPGAGIAAAIGFVLGFGFDQARTRWAGRQGT